ncbi:Sensory transduction histidine kinase, putative [Ketogulonicigenium vulgare WSH-001]|uniref:histidine kinase n=2 Tax=Ketogulonicigenium vulgare TaxID=92945 RepID=F9Y577_KETVW|nr:Sensory transduction histidine kinase, putative [Ketogulonicigenium vulgare WSH-001]
MLFIALCMLLAQVVSVSLYLSDRDTTASGRRVLPFPDQLEALVALMDTADPEDRMLLLRAVATEHTQAWLTPLPIENGLDPQSHEATTMLEGYSAWLAEYSVVLGSHPLEVSVADVRKSFLPVELRFSVVPQRVRVSVQLHDGTWLHVLRRPSPGLSFVGLPLGMFAALLLTGVAVLTMLIVWRETKPLRRLTAAVDAFGRDLKPRTLPLPRPPDLRFLVYAFNEMQQNISQADRSRSDMIAALSHDIRTPLARLTLRIRKLDPEIRAAAERDIERITRVADGAAHFTEAETITLDEQVDLRVLMLQVAQDYDLIVDDNAPQRPALINGSAALLERALSNMVENSRKYARNTRFTLTPGSSEHVVVVEDDGPGILPEDRARLLQPFQRGQIARTDDKSEGVGLGLYLANRIIARHGGSLLLEDAVPAGLRLVVTLPAYSDRAARTAPAGGRRFC